MAVVTREAGGGARARLRARRLTLAAAPLGAVLLALAIAGVAVWLYADRALPGVSVAGVDVGSLQRDALTQMLERQLAAPWAESAVVATADGRTYATTNGALGLRPDVRAAADAALAYGKSGSLGDRASAWVHALRGDARLPFTLVTANDSLERWLGAIAADAERPSASGSLAVSARGVDASAPVVGRRLDLTTAAALVLTADRLGDRELALPVRDVYPEVDDAGYRDALASAREAMTPLVVTIDEQRIAVDPAVLASFVRVSRVAARPGDLPALPSGAVVPATRYRYVVSVDDQKVAEWVQGLARSLDRASSNARYRVNAEGRLTVVPGVIGLTLDQDKMRSLVTSGLTTSIGTSVREIAAPGTRDTTTFTTAQANEWLAKLQRTSTFTTYFPVSYSRHANIATGSSQFDGVVILPGQTFSFWDLLGPVTTERGYAYAGAIINNRSDESVIGGGLCQVSTTMFNAIARLGYEIVERHEHGYLIERYPIGLDAAVFDPGSDFRWKNDTASPVFLWSWVSDTSVTFDVWGLPTGRAVTFTDPVQSRFVDVPADQPADPAFPAGYAVRGRDVVRTRTVVENGTVLHRDTFFSRYAPVWGGPPAAGGTLIVR